MRRLNLALGRTLGGGPWGQKWWGAVEARVGAQTWGWHLGVGQGFGETCLFYGCMRLFVWCNQQVFSNTNTALHRPVWNFSSKQFTRQLPFFRSVQWCRRRKRGSRHSLNETSTSAPVRRHFRLACESTFHARFAGNAVRQWIQYLFHVKKRSL